MKNSTILFPVHARWKIGRRALRSIYMVNLQRSLGIHRLRPRQVPMRIKILAKNKSEGIGQETKCIWYYSNFQENGPSWRILGLNRPKLTFRKWSTKNAQPYPQPGTSQNLVVSNATLPPHFSDFTTSSQNGHNLYNCGRYRNDNLRVYIEM